MKILTKYVIKSYMKPFIYSMVLFTMIIMIAQIFENIKLMLNNNVPLKTSVTYFIFKIPYLFIQMMPVAVLMATLFSLGTLSKNSEITVMKTCGINLTYIVFPLIVIGFLFSVVNIIFNETIVPYSQWQVRYIKKVKIYKDKNFLYRQRNNLSTWGAGKYLYYIKNFNAKSNTMHKISIYFFDDTGATNKIYYIDKCVYDETKKEWTGINVREKLIKNNQLVAANKYEKKVLPDLNDRPKQFQKRYKKPYDMSYFELKNYVDNLKASGANYIEDIIELYSKISFPFTNLVMVFIGLPFAFTGSKKNIGVMGFIISIMISFLYWSMFQIGKTLGISGVLHPVLSAWWANIIFILAGFLLFKRVRT